MQLLKFMRHNCTLHAASAIQPARVDQNRSGVLAAVAAFFLWGMLPLFWKQLDFLPPASIVAQRTIWSLAILVTVLYRLKILWRAHDFKPAAYFCADLAGGRHLRIRRRQACQQITDF